MLSRLRAASPRRTLEEGLDVLADSLVVRLVVLGEDETRPASRPIGGASWRLGLARLIGHGRQV